MKLSALTTGLLAATTAVSAVRHVPGMQIGPLDPEFSALAATDLTINGTNGWGTFDQLIDHSNPGLGTFKQRFWYGSEFWKGPGSPIFLVDPGEQAADGFNRTYTTTQRLAGLFAKTMGGAVVILEHRYWGESAPSEELTVANLQYLTLDNAIKDHSYFARNFKAPFDNTTDGSSPDNAPWVFSGGSYPGALAAWIAVKDPGTFWAYHGTSGVVEVISDFWQYFVPVMEAAPANCTKDLTEVIDYVDQILLHGTDKQKQKLKAKFKLEDVEDADFANALEFGPWTWQSGQFYTEGTLGYTPFYQFCDYIENVWPNSTNEVPGPEGVGQCKALEGYAKWFTEVELPGTCEGYGYDEFQGELNIECFKMLNASNPIYHDLSLGNAGNRQWNWMLCNEPFEWWQDATPADRPSFVSRLINPDYWRSQCPFWFPESEGGYGLARGRTAEEVNAYTSGWFVDAANTTRLMMTNGEWDPWRDATLSSKFRPGGPKESTPELPVRVIPHGTHCSDLYGQNWGVNAELKAIVDEEVANMQEWVGEFYEKKERRRAWSA
ncbi:peptidase S28 [Coniochaeta sp. 2T2.1]|nr:peptidase S28 [Coniochaeta sp. 2T2.1]